MNPHVKVRIKTRAASVVLALAFSPPHMSAALEGESRAPSTVVEIPGARPPSLRQAIDEDLDQGRIVPLGGLGNLDALLFEATVCPYYTLGVRRAALVFAFKGTFRMNRTQSNPVRTPSFMPRLVYYNYGNEYDDGSFDYYYIMLEHHSNGQEGPFLNADGRLNRDNGSFQTNSIEFGLFYPHKKTWKLPRQTVGAAIRVHFLSEAGLSDTDYGFYRFRVWRNFNIGKHMDLSVSSFAIFGPLHEADTWDYKRLGIDISLSHSWSASQDFRFFANVYAGQDYYNISYTRYLTVLRIGLVTSVGLPV